jgi:CBASS immunity sensor of nucleotide second messenger signals
LANCRSLNHAVDQLEDRCVRVLDFVPEFDEQYIRDPNEWSETLYPQLKTFLLDAAAEGERPRFALDAHTTLAFAAGTVLNTKVGRVIELEQGSPKRAVWSSDVGEWDPVDHGITLTELKLDAANPEVAVACSITHEIVDDATLTCATRTRVTVRAPNARLLAPARRHRWLKPMDHSIAEQGR